MKRRGMVSQVGFALLLILILSLSPATLAEAAIFCVDTPATLQEALNAAAGNSAGDVVQIVQGTYVGNFTYISGEPYGLTIEGGYTAACASRVAAPQSTTLDADGTGTVLSLSGWDLAIDGVTIQHGVTSGIVATAVGNLVLRHNVVRNNGAGTDGSGGGAKLGGRMIEITGNTFLSNTAGAGGAIDIQSNSETVSLRNNVISHNTANRAEGGGVHIKYLSGAVTFANNVIIGNATTRYISGGHGGGAHISTSGPVNFINNTVAGNSTTPECCWGGGITIYYASFANVYNNIFWENTSTYPGHDITFYSINPATVNLFNNDLDQSPDGVAGLGNYTFDSSNQNKLNPLFRNPANGDYHLQFASPCIDTGANAAPDLAATDIDGAVRTANGTVDMGAFEYSVRLDILPEDDSNTISLRRTKKIPVAIRSTSDFLAATVVDRDSLTFGATGDEWSFPSCARKQKDIDGDALIDLVCQFSLSLTYLPCGETVGILRGQSLDGRSFEGRQVVVVTECK